MPVRAVRVHDLPRPLRLPAGSRVPASDSERTGGRVRDQVQPVGVVVGDGQGLGVDLHHGVLVTVDVQVQPGHDEVLVERRVRPVVDDGAGARGLGPLGVRRGHHDPGGAHLALDVAVLVEAPVDEVLVVGHRDVAGDDHAAHPADLGAGLAVDVLPEDRVVLLVETDRVRDVVGLARAVVQHGVDVDDLPEAVAAELERRGHVAQAPLADVERGAPVVVERGVAVRDDHLREGQAVGDVADVAVVVVGDLVDDRSLAVVEAQPHRPVLPAQLGALDREGHALGLGDVQGLEVRTLLAGPDARDVLALHVRRPEVEVLLDLQQLHGVHVDDELDARTPGGRTGCRPGPRAARRRTSPVAGPATAPASAPCRRSTRR